MAPKSREIAFVFRREVSPTSLTNSCVFPGFLDINLNGTCVSTPTAANVSGAASAGKARLRRRGLHALARD